MAGTKFKLRNRYKEEQGSFTAEEILRDIRDQRLTGDEEVSRKPYETWVPISSQPEFFDAFLKRLFSNQYKSPDDGAKRSGRTKSALMKKEKATSPQETRVQKTRVGRTKVGDKDAEKAEMGAATSVDPAKTFQANAEDLFQNTNFSKSALGEGNGLSQAIEEAPPDVQFPTQLDTEGRVAEEESPSVAWKQAMLKRRKLWLALSTGAALGILVLMLPSGERTPADEPDPDAWIRQGENSATPKEMVGTLIDEADSLARADTHLFYEAAVKVLREALALEPSNIETLSKFTQYACFLLPSSREPEKLIQEIRSSIRRGRTIDPQVSHFYRAEGRLALLTGDFEASKESVIRAAETDPNHPETYQLMAEVYYAGKDLEQAKSALLETVKAQPNNVRTRYWLARVARELGDNTRAASEAFEAIKLNPLHAASYLVMAEAFLSNGSYAEATGYLNNAGKLAKFSAPEVTARAYALLADAQIRLGKKQDAARSFQLAYHYEPGSVPQKLKDKFSTADLSSKALRRLAREAEFPADYFQEQGEGLAGQGKLGEAILFFQAAQLLKPDSGQALIRLGELTEKTATSYEDYRKVTILYQRALEKAPRDPAAYVRLGSLETDQYNFERGQRLLDRARELAPNDANVLVALAKHFFKRQDYKQAARYLFDAEKIDRKLSQNPFLQGKILLLLGKNAAQNAMPFFYRAYELDDQNYEALAEWLKLKVAVFEKTFAIKFARNLLELQPKNPNLLWVLGEIYAAAKEHRRAVTYYHDALDLDNRASRVRMSLARSLEAVGELEKAVAEYRLASLLDRRNSDGFYKAAELYFQGKNFPQAEEIVKTLLEVTPHYPGAHRLYSKIHQARKSKDLAIEELKREVANNPENYDFVLELSELYLEYERFDLALKELTKVTQLPWPLKSPEFRLQKTRAYLLLSRTYRLMGKAENAESPIKLALELDPNDPELHKELGNVYFAVQRDKEGVKAYEFYLRANPAAFDAEVIKDRIEKMRIEE